MKEFPPQEVDPIECNINAMSREQRRFYDYWLSELYGGRSVEVEDEFAYIGIYVDCLNEELLVRKNLHKYVSLINQIGDVYFGNPKMKSFLDRSKAYAFLLFHDYEKAWKFLSQTQFISVTDVLNVLSKCRDKSLNGELLFKIVGKKGCGLTPFGLKNLNSVIDNLTKSLDEYENGNGRNVIADFCGQFDFHDLSEDDFETLEELYSDKKLFEYMKIQYKKWVGCTLSDEEENRLSLLLRKYYKVGGIPDWFPKKGHGIRKQLFPDAFMDEPFLPPIVRMAVEGEIRRLFRNCENKTRSEQGLPEIGDGWISETELFEAVRKHFSDEKVVKHARPHWLAPQHLDIYFPIRNIGIEYQGVQHLRPVDYFGGLDAFEKQQLRDERKKKRCENNNCQLIYVSENYSFDEIVDQIESLTMIQS